MARDRKPFLTAEWRNLLLINDAVDEKILSEYLPPGCELDRLDGRCFASLVAFDFQETRVFGVRWPGFTNFPEINLRIYVRFGDVRGVVFVRELVPGRLVAAIARWLYNEPYERAKMTPPRAPKFSGTDWLHPSRRQRLQFVIAWSR